MEAYEKEHFDRVIRMGGECAVLLRTDGAFPLRSPGKIAAFGGGVRYTVKGGTGSGEVNSRFSVNVEQGLLDAGFTITSSAWLDGYDRTIADAKKRFVKRLKAEARAAHRLSVLYCMGKAMPEPEHDLPLSGEGDTAIYVVGRNSGEGADREPIPGDILLTESEIRDIRALSERYERFMLVLNVGGPVDLSPVAEVSNILILSQLGAATGTVLAEILLGKQNPSGKLATTWAAWKDYSTIGDFGDPDDTCYREGIYVGYRYFDTVGKKALFPFGYGRSFTTFSVTPQEFTAVGDHVTVSVTVQNTGIRAGKEVVQVYVSAPQGKLDKPYQDLAGFAKTGLLEPGGEQTLAVSFRLSDLASYDTDAAAYILESGQYVVRVGTDSVHTSVIGTLRLDETATVLRAKNCLGTPGFSDWKPEKRTVREKLNDVKEISFSASDITASAVQYDAEETVDPIIQGLSDEELAYLSVGAFDPKSIAPSVIGNAAKHVAGAAGETTSLLAAKGIPALVMADGPAGLRLSGQYYADAKGVHAVGGAVIPDSMLEFVGGFTGSALRLIGRIWGRPPRGAELREQYATALPIGTAIAQSFNCDLAKECGDIVGSEMERFGVQLWLAPALNIHRNIRCGRNFEYYSEDPLVSGLMAAALVEGVQAHRGCGATIKHFAGNNAEINRYANNSRVSERAMREIYLRGFGICIRKADPCAVMTSYNLLNGIHTSEHRGLTHEVLRCEYGFRGIVMSDWVIAITAAKDSKYREARAAESAMAGGDLFMPGSRNDYAGVLRAIRDGTLSRRQAERSASRVYRMARKLTGKSNEAASAANEESRLQQEMK